MGQKYERIKSFPPCYSHSILLTDFTPPPPPPSKSGLKLACNVNIVYGNHKSENSKGYAQKPQRNRMFMNSSSCLFQVQIPDWVHHKFPHVIVKENAFCRPYEIMCKFKHRIYSIQESAYFRKRRSTCRHAKRYWHADSAVGRNYVANPSRILTGKGVGRQRGAGIAMGSNKCHQHRYQQAQLVDRNRCRHPQLCWQAKVSAGTGADRYK